ncbi:MAG: hypothetical protein AAGJ80_07690 [Cyanobacteria bacterium J06553_1]
MDRWPVVVAVVVVVAVAAAASKRLQTSRRPASLFFLQHVGVSNIEDARVSPDAP